MTAPELLSMNATILCDALTIASLELFPANDTLTLRQMMKRHEFPLWTSQTLWFCRHPSGPAFWFGTPCFWTREGKTERVFLENFQENLLDKTEGGIIIIFSRGLFISTGRPLTPPLTRSWWLWRIVHGSSCTWMYTLAMSWGRSWVCAILSCTLASFGSKCRGVASGLLQKVPDLTLHRDPPQISWVPHCRHSKEEHNSQERCIFWRETQKSWRAEEL